MDFMSKWLPWQREVAGLAILYRLTVMKEKMPVSTGGTDFEFVEPLFDELYKKGMIQFMPGGTEWEIAPSGVKALRTARQVYDHLLHFDIFAKVDITRSLTPDEASSTDPNQVFDNIYDPRFGDPNQKDQPGKWEDMRLAVITFLATVSDEVVDLNPHKIVFLQKLAAGYLQEKDFWFNLRLGKTFDEINAIVDSALKWRDIAGDEQGAIAAMQAIRTAGMLEQRKRDGKECSNCGTPLAVYQAQATFEGKTLDACPNPNCGASFSPPPKTGLECPNCHADIDPSQTVCVCGAHLDYSLPPGTIQRQEVAETVQETQVVDVWGSYYDPMFVPYGYYDPWLWSPVDALAFGVVCAALW